MIRQAKPKRLCLALLLLAPAVGGATDISVGGVPLAIPNPKGFTPITQQMTLLYDLEQRLIAPTNAEYAAFISEQDVPAALRGEVSGISRRFSVQTAKTIIGASVSTADFVKLKNMIKSQNAELMKNVEKQLPGVMKQLTDGIKSKYNVDLALSVSQMVPMPVHEETERTLAYSSFIKYDMKDANGAPAPFVVVVTMTFAHAKSKVLFLYCFAEESGLEWSRTAARQWGNAVVAANPSDRQTSVKEASSLSTSGFDWEKVGSKAMAGALIGLIIGLISWAMKRGKSS